MRAVVPFLIALCLAAQDAATYHRSSVDVNGQRIEGPQITELKTKTAYERTERQRSINGRMVPLERIEEHVVRDDGSQRVVERVIRRYDQDGNPAPPEKTLIEEQKTPGAVTVRTTTFRGDINGGLEPAERSMTETRRNGAQENSETLVERPTINGSFEPVEKRVVERTGSDTAYRESATTYRKGTDGFYEAVRVVTDHSQQGSTNRDQTSQYEVGSGGSLELRSQTVRTQIRQPNGSETETLDLFGQFVPGVASTSGQRLALKERDTVQRTFAADGSLRETSSVQRPTVSDPEVLGPSRVISEVVCKGKCHE